MNKKLDILIDGSGSMGYMKNTPDENKYLLTGTKHTKTDLVKKLLQNDFFEILNTFDSIDINIFEMIDERDKNWKPIVIEGIKKQKPYLESIYSGPFFKINYSNRIPKIKNPEPGGTPLYWGISSRLTYEMKSNHQIVVFTDGGNNININSKKSWVDELKEDRIVRNNNSVIHIVGIKQNSSAKENCKELCAVTGGKYIHLKSMAYNTVEVNSIIDVLRRKKPDEVSLLDSNVNSEEENNSIETSNSSEKPVEFKDSKLERQVNQNTQSLEKIDDSLKRIISLLTKSGKIETEENVDVYENKAYNRCIGRKAEVFCYEELKRMKFDKVEWLNEDVEQYNPYDFIVHHKNKTYYYECKGSAEDLNEFQMTKNEWNYYLEHRGFYRVCFVSNVDNQPRMTRFMDLLDNLSEEHLLPYFGKANKIKADRIRFKTNL